jgi:outer membrane protein assembly factor BamB
VVANQAQGHPSVRAYDAANGHAKWSRKLPANSFVALVAVANGLVYVTVHPSSGSDELVTYDAANGHARWTLTPPAPGTGPVIIVTPVVDGDRAFVAATASSDAELSAVDTSGNVVWSAIPGGSVFLAAPVAANSGQTVYIASFERTGNGVALLTGYAEADGAVQSAVTVQQTDQPQPIESIAFSNGAVFGSGYTAFGRLSGLGGFRVDPNTGVVAWSHDLFEEAVAPDTAFTSNPRTTEVIARDPGTGAQRWTMLANGVTVAGSLVFGASGDTITVHRLSDGAVVATVQPAPGETVTAPIPSNGRLYTASLDRLYALSP